MSKIFSYNFEKYSPRDIVAFSSENGMKIIFQKGIPGEQERGFLIDGTSILVRIPPARYILDLKFDPLTSLLGDVRWDTYSSIYYPNKEEAIEKDHTFGPRNDGLFKQHEKLFDQLKKKFQMKKGEIPKAIKDLDWIRNVEKYGYEKAEKLYAEQNG